MKIKSIHAQEVLDSRGNPTVHTETLLEDGTLGVAAVPSGASTGKYEAVELRDGDMQRYGGQGVLKAVENVNNQISQALLGHDAENQRGVDHLMNELDGTENKSVLGANAILSVSLSIARAEAISEKKELFEYLTKYNPDFNGTYTMPVPEMNVMNGGKHANWATDIQEFMLFPLGAVSFSEAVRMNVEIYQELKGVIKSKSYAITVGDEGGFAPEVSSNEEPFSLLSEAIQKTKYSLGHDIFFGIDAAASEFYKEGKYDLKKERKVFSGDELIEYYQKLINTYPIISVEDTFSEDDWESFQKLTSLVGDSVQTVGDDLYVTNVRRLQKGIDNKTTNSILIKLNQIGTLTETIDAILLARKNGLSSIISHRSGETEDTFIADLSVALGTGQIKSGAPSRSERVAKYNRLLNIELLLAGKAIYPTLPFKK